MDAPEGYNRPSIHGIYCGGTVYWHNESKIVFGKSEKQIGLRKKRNAIPIQRFLQVKLLRLKVFFRLNCLMKQSSSIKLVVLLRYNRAAETGFMNNETVEAPIITD